MTTTNTLDQIDLLDPFTRSRPSPGSSTSAWTLPASTPTGTTYPRLCPGVANLWDREDVLRYASIGAGTCSVYPDIDNLHLVASIGRRRRDLCKRKEGWGGTFVCIDVRSAQLGADEPAQRVPAPGPRHPGRHAGRAGAADSLHHFLPVTVAPCDPHAFWNPPMRLAKIRIRRSPWWSARSCEVVSRTASKPV